ncbi:MAG: 30S ribosomal protein S12 methylthiotransferase RimO [Sedimentisphaerales bacterium]|jgi:ribosomal protein S12 methylthiotransferase|nr:30S ribosomal protein S12 methylthiotransferase RimO [Sedimentisphaerales bacterium]HNY79462.1 30S ribosomal protein S12 methylthiotransferase RimO [Sedimentisphaerales bacterium]HOC64632.1 30S ribosomal protein S12 methylthiotransferase RimO [Sedimentisphaerales bacterium]HOH65425.1 30S ribosomal protein S12 methylthiotransferase RimO [Sedimentisphaerales bacterium]HPY52094.1 30S ribosomal protein S12 methylthiotransferase RimO [Sedimentisphaerales bacterium]
MTKSRKKKVAVGFVALGCPKNVVDSEKMLAEIVEAGFLIAADPSQADVVVVNTCGFIEPAKVESLDAIAQAVADKRNGRVQKVIVAGCLAQRLGAQLLDEAEGVDAVVGLGQRDSIVQIIRRTLAACEPGVYSDRTFPVPTDDRVRLRIGPAHSAYLRISEGCDHRCSFCTIPAIRGPFRSKPPELVLEEARELISSGAVELNLIGQDTTIYGRDLKMADGLAHLLGEMETIADLAWIRLLYAYPRGITVSLIDAIARSDKVLHYLDIPIQHASDKILRAMRRPDTSDGLRTMIERLRAAIPDIVLRTTVIVGFPGETDGDFSDLLEFIRWAQFDALGAFTFFPETGTAAAGFPDQIADDVKQDRLDTLMLAQQEIAFAKNRARVGQRLRCLIDSVDPQGIGYGRFYGQAPDIDAICIVTNCMAGPGSYADVDVVGVRDYDLLVEQICC